MSSSVITLKQLVRDPDNEDYSRLVVKVFGAVLARFKLNTRDMEKDEIVNRAFMSLRARLNKELAGNLEKEQKPYADIPIESEDFSRISYTILLNSISDLKDQERRHHRKRKDQKDFNNVSDVRPMASSLERQEELVERRTHVDELLKICSAGEKRVLEELLKADCDCAQAAKNLDVTVNYVHVVLSRIRLRIGEKEPPA
jgi:hypothetical protein